MDLNRVIVYDVEVERGPNEVDGGWDNPEGMGFASAVVYSYEDNRYRFFLGPEQRVDLVNFLSEWRIEERIAVSFNGVKFDSRVVLGNARILDHGISDGPALVMHGDKGWEEYDILLQYVRSRFGCADVLDAEKRLGDKAIHDGSFGLDGLAEGTFGMNKTGHGANAPILFREKRYAELLEYNLQDVRLTRKLFEFISTHGFVVDRAGHAVKIPRP